MAFFNMKTLCIQEGSVWLYQERGEKALFGEAHDSCFVGHFAEKRIYELLQQRYWWPRMRADVRKYCWCVLQGRVMVVRSGQL